MGESLVPDELDDISKRVAINDQNSPANMMEADMDFMNDIEEVGEWPLYPF
jgi:hypothetical protein